MPDLARIPLAGIVSEGATAVVRRAGRFLLAELRGPHRVLSTSAYRGGQRDDIRFLVNHQTCEARGDSDRLERVRGLGTAGYHRFACGEAGVDPERTALMGTAANMACLAHRRAAYADLLAEAFVTAGVGGNAARAGDPARWVETDSGWSECEPEAGTINTLLLLNCEVTAAAQARAVVTMTEAKSAALAELAVPSLYSPTIATGTGTDQFCLAAPLDTGSRPKEATGPHAKLGELIGKAVKGAVAEALRWQNGLERTARLTGEGQGVKVS